MEKTIEEQIKDLKVTVYDCQAAIEHYKQESANANAKIAELVKQLQLEAASKSQPLPPTEDK